MQPRIINPNDKNEFTVCQKCNKSLIGDKLKRYEAQFTGEHTHYSSLIPIVEDMMVVAYECPHCGFTFNIFGKDDHDTPTQEV